MAIPSGSGTEVLKYSKLTALSNTDTDGITGVANHIYTIISIIAVEMSSTADELLNMRLFDSDGTSNQHWLMYQQPLPRSKIFVWNDKFVFSGDKRLRFYLTSAGDADVFISYIDQDWT